VHAASPAGWSHFDTDRWELFHIENDRSQCHDLADHHPDKLDELKALWFAEAEKYNGLPLGDLNILETMSRFRPYLAGARDAYAYYPGTADVGMGAAVEIGGRSFAVMAEVTIDDERAHGVLFKHGGGHGGHVMFVQDGRLHYVYNFLGEAEQKMTSSEPIPLGRHSFGVAYVRTGTVEGSHTPAGDAALYVDGAEVASYQAMMIHPGTFGLAGATLSVGRNDGSPVSRDYRPPFAFTGGTIALVTVDVSGKPYLDLEREFARAFAKD
jgi:arylsulfatase